MRRSSYPAPFFYLMFAGRLLLQRLRKSQSTTVLYGEPENALEQLQLHDGTGSGLFPQIDGTESQVGVTLGAHVFRWAGCSCW